MKPEDEPSHKVFRTGTRVRALVLLIGSWTQIEAGREGVVIEVRISGEYPIDVNFGGDGPRGGIVGCKPDELEVLP